MIHGLSIKSKDFSTDLPHIIAQLKIIRGSIEDELENDVQDLTVISVASEYLKECINDMETINKALYWPDELEKAV